MSEEKEKEKGMTFEERASMVEKAGSPSSSTPLANDDDVLNPEPVKIILGSREYLMRPLKLNQMRYLIKLSKVNLKVFDEEQLQVVVDCVSLILGEKDKEFIESELDIPIILRIFTEIQRLNYKGVPLPKAGDKSTAGN